MTYLEAQLKYILTFGCDVMDDIGLEILRNGIIDEDFMQDLYEEITRAVSLKIKIKISDNCLLEDSFVRKFFDYHRKEAT